MDEIWDLARLQKYIDNEIEESLTLDYKASGALQKSDGKKKEITKDVSAMANSAGGLIIYGISEYQQPDDKKHLPEKFDPVCLSEYSKEWLEQVIMNIRPRIDGIIIHPVHVEENQVIYVVDIPQSNLAHQATDHRYYKRFNFQSVPMEDHEIRDVNNRSNIPNVDVKFFCRDYSSESEGIWVTLRATVKNHGNKLVNNFKLRILLPALNNVSLTGIESHPVPDPVGKIKQLVTNPPNTIITIKDNIYEIVYRSKGVLFPEDIEEADFYLRYLFKVNYEKLSAIDNPLKWTLYADEMPKKNGKLPLAEIHPLNGFREIK